MSERLSDLLIGFGHDEWVRSEVKALTEQEAFGPRTSNREVSGAKFMPNWLDKEGGVSPVFVALGYIGIGEAKQPTSAVLATQHVTIDAPHKKYLVIHAAGSVPTMPAPEDARGHAQELIASFAEAAKMTDHDHLRIGYPLEPGGNPERFYGDCGFERMVKDNPHSPMVHWLGDVVTSEIFPGDHGDEDLGGVRKQLEADVETIREQKYAARLVNMARTAR